MYNNIKLEKGLYSITNKTFTQALTELDPDEQYENTSMKKLDAFERQLKRFNIKVGGTDSDKVEKFFLSTESAVLFPEYVRRMIKKGMDEASLTPEIVGAVSYTDSADFRGLKVTSMGSSITGESAALPVTTVRLSTSSIPLKKFARKLSCSYESIRKQRLEAFGVILQGLGASLSRDINHACIDDMTKDLEPSVQSSAITYSDLAKFWSSMGDHDMTTMICSPETMAEILALDEMKYCVSDFMTSGKVKTPYGVTIVKCPQLDKNTTVGIDKTCAVEMVFGTDIIVDFDKLISSQCDEIACSVTVGFSTLTADAVKILKTTK